MDFDDLDADLLDILLEEDGLKTPASDTQTPTSDTSLMSGPLSRQQQGLWMVDRLSQHRSGYNLSTALLLEGDLHHDALRKALQHLVDRHETLRTIIHGDTPGPTQQTILSEWSLTLHTESLSQASPDRIAALSDAEAHRPFDLRQSPGVRARLLVLAERRHIVILTVHHIFCDGWSMSLLAHELSVLYQAERLGAQPRLPRVGTRYLDYAVAQQGRLTPDRLHRSIEYWRTKLAEVPELCLPLDKPRPDTELLSIGERVDFHLPVGDVAALRALTSSVQAPINAGLMTAILIVLARQCDQLDVVIGAATANRDAHSWRATLSQPLFRADRWFQLQAAEATNEQAALQLSATEQNLILQSAENYFAVLRAQDNLASTKAEENAFKRQLDQSNERFDVGLSDKTDVLQSQASYDTARANQALVNALLKLSVDCAPDTACLSSTR